MRPPRFLNSAMSLAMAWLVRCVALAARERPEPRRCGALVVVLVVFWLLLWDMGPPVGTDGPRIGGTPARGAGMAAEVQDPQLAAGVARGGGGGPRLEHEALFLQQAGEQAPAAAAGVGHHHLGHAVGVALDHAGQEPCVVALVHDVAG